MKHVLAFFLFLISVDFCNCQTNNIWIFRNVGVDFNSYPTKIIKVAKIDSLTSYYPSICDSSGNLLFYTNGESVFGKNAKLLKNSKGLISDDNDQSVLILPKPGSNSLFYIFHVKSELNGFIPYANLYYSIVDMKANNNLGEVISKNNLILKGCISALTAVKHGNKKDFWLVASSEIDTFYSFQISSSGISSPKISMQPVSINLKPIGGNFIQTDKIIRLRASNNGQLLVKAFSCSVKEVNGPNDFYYEH